MQLADLLGMAWSTIRAHRLRSALTMLGIAIGIASVILLTSLNAIEDKVRGQEAGADDFVTKPFGLLELLAQLAERS